MDWTLNFREDGILEITTFGEFSNSGLVKMIEQIVLDPKWKPGMDVIADFREIFVERMKIDDIYEAKNIHLQFNDMAGDGKIAAILSSNLAFGFSRVYEAVSRLYVKSKIMTFKSYDKGVDWIKGRLDLDMDFY